MKKKLTLLGAVTLGCLGVLAVMKVKNGGGADDTKESEEEYISLDTGLQSHEERSRDYTAEYRELSNANEFLPIWALYGLQTEGKNLLEWADHYGFITSEGYRGEVPLGFSVKESDAFLFDNAQVGISCAACHTGVVKYEGQSYLVDGMPGMVDFEEWTLKLMQALDENITTYKIGRTLGTFKRALEYSLKWGANKQGEKLIAASFLNQEKVEPGSLVSEIEQNVIEVSDLLMESLILEALVSEYGLDPKKQAMKDASQKEYIVEGYDFPANMDEIEVAFQNTSGELDEGAGRAPASMSRPINSVAANEKAILPLPPEIEEKRAQLAFEIATKGNLDPLYTSNFLKQEETSEKDNTLPPNQELFFDSIRTGYEKNFERVLLMMAQFRAIRRQLKGLTKGAEMMNATQMPGLGRDDAWSAIDVILGEGGYATFQTPLSIPSLYYVNKYEWFHYDGNTNSKAERNIAQSLALGTKFDPVSGKTDLTVEMVDHTNEILDQFQAPKWPEVFGKLDQKKVEQGRKIFYQKKYKVTGVYDLENREQGEMQRSCADCHSIASDDAPQYFYNVGTSEARWRQSYDNAEAISGVYKQVSIVTNYIYRDSAELREMKPWVARKGYKARTLDGIWSTAPYLHNGSIPNLTSLFSPYEERPKTFWVGNLEYDPKNVGFRMEKPVGKHATLFDEGELKANSAKGHTFGTELKPNEKRALIEYLKSL